MYLSVSIGLILHTLDSIRESYTWWWIFLLVFEVIGGLLVSADNRKPIDEEALRYGKAGWFLIHFIFIITIFLGGFYMGRVTMK